MSIPQPEMPAKALLEEIEQFADRDDLTTDDLPKLIEYRDILDRAITKAKINQAEK